MRIKETEFMKMLKNEIKEMLAEYYPIGTGAKPPMHALVSSGDEEPSRGTIAVDKNELAASIRALIGGDAGYPIGEWGDEALNDAARMAAESLITSSGYDSDYDDHKSYHKK